MPACYSELKAQRELKVALALADAAALRSDLSKVRAGRIEVHSAAAASTPIRMVEDVEGFGAELESETFVHRDRLKQPHVPVPESGLIDQVTDTLCVEGPVCRRAEDRRAVRIGCRE